jgi:hypothetical protein
MPGIKTVEKWAPVAGALLLFGAWAVQQLLSAEWNAALARIGAAEAVFHSYRSSNGVFRALRHLTASSEEEASIDREQQMNYELGLREVLRTVDQSLHDKHLKRQVETLEEGVTLDTLTVNARIMVLFAALTATLVEQRSALVERKDAAQRTFLVLYIVGTLLVILGGAAKASAVAEKR